MSSRRSVVLLLLALAGCPKQREVVVDVVGPLVAEADAAWANREAGYDPVITALDTAWQTEPDNPEVLWRLVRLHVALGLAAPDDRQALQEFATARSLGIDCLDLGPALQRADTAEQLDNALSGLGARQGTCAAWTSLAWVRWMIVFGPDAAALDIPVIESLVRRAEGLEAEPWIVDWSRGLLAAVRPVNRDLEASRRILGSVVERRPDNLWPRVDLVLRVAGPLGDQALAQEQIGFVQTAKPRNLEDEGAVRALQADQLRAPSP